MKASAHIAVLRHSFAQRGAATVGIAILVVLLMGAAISVALSLSGSVARDAATADQQLQALFIAESGMERATKRFVDGASCVGLAETNIAMGTVGSFTISGMNTMFDNVTSSGSSCRVRVTGRTTAGQVVRVIESIITPNISYASQDFTCKVPAGTNRLIVVSVSWTANTAVSITGVTFGGAGMTAADAVSQITGSTEVYSAQNFYLVNPTVGLDIDGTITMNGNPGRFVVVACNAFNGVDASAPIDAFAKLTGTSVGGAPFGVSITTSATNTSGFVIDNLARDNGGTLNMTPVSSPNRAENYNNPASGKAAARSSRGPILIASTPTNMSWTMSGGGNKSWASAALAVKADAMSWEEARRVRLSSVLSSARAWREVAVPSS